MRHSWIGDNLSTIALKRDILMPHSMQAVIVTVYKQKLQDDIDKLVRWSEKWQMLFNFGKCKCLLETLA